MKCPKRDDRRNNNNNNRKRAKTLKNNKDHINELLRICLDKVYELQADLQRTNDQEQDAEAAGYAACALETLRFLSAEGIPPSHPMVRTLTEHLLKDQNLDNNN